MNPLFQERLNRAQLLSLPPPQDARPLHITVFRNHAFEYVAPALNAFLALSNLRAVFHYSNYDDSFSFSNMPEQADICLLWVDASRYTLPDFMAWISSRVDVLRRKTKGHILAACTGLSSLKRPCGSGNLFIDVDGILEPLGSAAWDSAREDLTGTKLSNLACLHIARELGTRRIPALLSPPLKALILDLDNTLYAGVLGEDGPDALSPYVALQSYLVELKQQGFMLALASKNEEADVRELFSRRRDFPLGWEDFTAVAINWAHKADNLAAIANVLNIGMDAMLFIDDNPGEIAQAARAFPELHILEAVDPLQTLAALRYYPGLYKPSVTREDGLRTADIAANAERKRLSEEAGSENYLRELALKLTFHVNDRNHAERSAVLSNKTNQFILSFLRPSDADIAAYLSSPDRCMVTLSLADRLSDSGVVAVALASTKGASADLDELVFSCRALGRGIEHAAICRMLKLVSEALGTRGIRLHYSRGPRNKPALMWLEQVTGVTLDESGSVMLEVIPDSHLQGAEIALLRN